MSFVRRPARSRALSSLLLLPLLGGGCAALKSRFPSHEDVFKPVPLTIGELRVEGADSTYVLAGRGYEIVAPSREMLSDAEKAVDAVSRAYVRYFDAEPRPIVVRLLPVRRDRSDAARDSLARARRQPLPRDARGRRVVVVPVYVADERRRGGPGGPDMPMSRFMFGDVAVAQAWVAAYADAYTDTAGSTRADGGRPRRLPDWLAAGAVQLIAQRPFQELAIGRLNERQKELMPLRVLFDSTRAPSAAGPEAGGGVPPLPDEEEEMRMRRDRMDPGGRRGGNVDMFSAQSLAVAQFLADREGPAFIGRLAERLVRGDRPADAFAEARTLPHDLDALDGQFRSWLEELGARTRRVRG